MRSDCPRSCGGRFCRRPAEFSGFSLIELLVTLALLLIMVVMWHGFGSRSNQQRQKRACEQNLQTIFMALDLYATEHDGRFPVVTNAQSSEAALALLVPRYTVASERFVCPGSKDGSIPSAAALEDQRISYAYFMGRSRTEMGAVLMSDRLVDPSPKKQGDPAFSANGRPPGNNHHRYGGNFLLTDGEIRSSGPAASVAVQWSPEILLLNPK
jgi:prepilin-type N-terminal cleavage/methylation domain-containing protein